MGCANSKAAAEEATKSDATKVAVPAGVAAPTLREEPVAVMEPEGEAAEPVAEGEAAEATADPMKQISEDVTRTWALVAAGPLEPVGVAFFLKIFEIAPEALQLFPFKDEPDLAESPKLKKHAMSVMNTVDAAVKGLADLDKLVPVLQGLGKRHVGYGVLPAHYDVVGQALLATLEGGLGAEWTEQVKASWTAVYGVIAKTMIGDNYPEIGRASCRERV